MNNNCAQKGIMKIGICTGEILARTKKKPWLKCQYGHWQSKKLDEIRFILALMQ